MKESSSVLNIIIALVLTVLAFSAYVFLYKDRQIDPEELKVRAKGQVNDLVVTDLIGLVDRVKDVSLPVNVFQSAVYTSLVSTYSLPVPQEPAGRPDPFAPVPGIINTSR